MSTELIYAIPSEAEETPLAIVLDQALHLTAGSTGKMIEKLTRENFRLMKRNNKVVAGNAWIHMGQWFGGKSVPTVGISVVGVVPEERGGGVGKLMMQNVLKELYDEGIPLSTLYPATLKFYQGVGYERAGTRLSYELPLSAIDVQDKEYELVPITANDHSLLKTLYEKKAKQSAGNLDRPELIWEWKLTPPDQQPKGYLLRHNGRDDGYILYLQAARTDPITIIDLCTLTPGAGRRVLTLLASYRSMVEKVVWSGGHQDPLLYLLEEPAISLSPKVKITRFFYWVMRIVDAEKALLGRGYSPAIKASLHLDLHDDLLPGNNRKFILDIEEGEATVRPGGQGRIRLDIRDLAAIYTGFSSPQEWQSLGHIEGSPVDLAVMGAVFAGPQPFIKDMF